MGFLGHTCDKTRFCDSSQAYIVRENFRESCINLGNSCIGVYEFFLSYWQKSPPTTQGHSNPLRLSSRASLDECLSKVCHSCLAFAEEMFTTAVSIVSELERCQNQSPMTIEKQWEKGQHFLLRGRAHHNVGRTLCDLAQFETLTMQQQGWHKSKDFLRKAREEFNHAVQKANALRRNAVIIRGHADAGDASTQNDCSWEAEGVVHFLEAIKLESLTSGLQIACLCQLNFVKDAEERFRGFSGSVDTVDIMKCVSMKGVTHYEIAETLDDMYCFAMTVAESMTQSLEGMAKKKGLDVLAGEKLQQIARAALERAISISDQLLSFDKQHSLNYEKEHIVTSTALKKQEDELIRSWETAKSQAQKLLSDVVQSAHANNAVRSTLPRTEIREPGCPPSHNTAIARRFFVQNGRPILSRSSSSRMRGVKKNSPEAEGRAQSARLFGSAFSLDNHAHTSGGDSTVPEPSGKKSTIVYRKWGDEILGEQKPTCPPLPEGLPIDVRRALEKKLRGILPTNTDGIFT